jgi:hypothetical protein
MRHFQMHVLHKTDFQLRVYRCFRRASTTRGRHSHEAHQAPQTRFHQARVGKTANSLLKGGAKIDLKNERKINRQTPPKSWANVRSKTRLKKARKGTSKSKKSRKTSKSESEKSPKKGQKWTSKTAPKMHPKIHSKIDHKSA